MVALADLHKVDEVLRSYKELEASVRSFVRENYAQLGALRRKQLTQMEVAIAAQVAQSNVSQVENGESYHLSLDTLLRILKVYRRLENGDA